MYKEKERTLILFRKKIVPGDCHKCLKELECSLVGESLHIDVPKRGRTDVLNIIVIEKGNAEIEAEA